MKALFVEELGEIGGQPEVGSRSGARDDEEQRRGLALPIERNAQGAASLESRELVSSGEHGHMDDLPLEPGGATIGVHYGTGDRGEIRIVIGKLVVLGVNRAPGKTDGRHHDDRKAHCPSSYRVLRRRCIVTIRPPHETASGMPRLEHGWGAAAKHLQTGSLEASRGK